MYEIEKGVSITVRRGNSKYPFLRMEIGDSFAVPKGKHNTASVSARNWGKRNGGRKFSARLEGDGIRIWRIA